jgi:hypothetical protein
MADDGNIVVVKRLSDAVPALLASPSPPEIKPQI